MASVRRGVASRASRSSTGARAARAAAAHPRRPGTMCPRLHQANARHHHQHHRHSNGLPPHRRQSRHSASPRQISGRMAAATTDSVRLGAPTPATPSIMGFRDATVRAVHATQTCHRRHRFSVEMASLLLLTPAVAETAVSAHRAHSLGKSRPTESARSVSAAPKQAVTAAPTQRATMGRKWQRKQMTKIA